MPEKRAAHDGRLQCRAEQSSGVSGGGSSSNLYISY
eukprot:COSAG06_NODE_22724_length_714_cov_23.011382_2_plen_35_part_01